jgi:DNA repair protein RadC
LTRINIELIVRENEIEELMNVKGIGEKSFLKLKALVVVPAKADKPAGQ